MRAVDFISIPARMNELWNWVVALDSWDYCDPKPLSELIANEKIIPGEFSQAIADIISGKRKPNKKAAAKLKIPARKRMKIAGSVSTIIGLINIFKYEAICDEGIGVIGLAAKQGCEPIEVLRELEGEAKEFIYNTCNSLNVSQETLENLLRGLRKKINHWPVV